MSQPSQEYLKREFVHHISDSLALLGAAPDLIKKIRGVEELPLTPQIIEEIRNFNTQQIDNVKNRLSLLNTIKVSSES